MERELSKNGFFILVATICLLQLLISILTQDSLANDGAEQVYFSQYLAWGYGFKQPSLYTWIFYFFSRLWSDFLLAFQLMQSLLAVGVLIVAYRIAALLRLSRLNQQLLVVSYLATQFFSYTIYYNYTHSLILAFFGLLTLWIFLRVVYFSRPGDYIALGVIMALAIFSKWSFGLYALSLFLGALSIASYRRAIYCRWMLLSVLLTLLLILLPCLWLLDNWQSIQTMNHFFNSNALDISVFSLVQALRVAFSLISHFFIFSQPMMLIYLVLLYLSYKNYYKDELGGWRSKLASFSLTKPGCFLLSSMLFFFLIYVLILTITRQDKIATHWTMPLMFMLPILLGVIVENLKPKQRYILFSMYFIVFLLLLTAGLRIYRSGDHCGFCYEQFDFSPLVSKLDESIELDDVTFVAFGGREKYQLVGNLRRFYPSAEMIYIADDYHKQIDNISNKQLVFIWYNHEYSSELPPLLASYKLDFFDLAPYQYVDNNCVALDPPKPGNFRANFWCYEQYEKK